MELENNSDFQQGALRPSGISQDEWIPMGTRSKDGVITPLPVQPSEPGLAENIAETDAGGATQELLFTGRAECVPDCVQRLVSLFDSPIISFMTLFIFQNDETAEERAGSLPPTQEVITYGSLPADTSGSLPPSDFTMQDGSPATNSDVDTQVIHDLMKGRIDSDRSSGKEILTM